MSPDFEGRNLVAVLDWAESLPALKRRPDGSMLVGSFGGSYGGMCQFLLMGTDPRQRLRVIAPDIAPHDLVYSLNAGEVVKSGYGLALVLGGELPLISVATGASPQVLFTATQELLSRGSLRQDAVVFETLLQAAFGNRLSPSSRNFLRYHSARYFCPDPLAIPARPFPAVDALITQGFRDTLFNFNDAPDNYECLRSRGGDVRLLTHQSGHILPLSLSNVALAPGSNLEQALDPFYAALTAPNFQDRGGGRRCGSLNLDDAQFAWFEEKLRGRARAVEAALGRHRDICLSLAEGDAIGVR